MQQVAGVLKMRMRCRNADSFATISATTDLALLPKVSLEQILQALRASEAVQTYAASDGRASE